MQYPFDLDTSELINERRPQWRALGVSDETMNQMRERIGSSWHGVSGSWPIEWSRMAEAARARGELFLAATLYGIAKFPVLGTPEHEAAFDSQRAVLLTAIAAESIEEFQRLRLSVQHGASVLDVPVHTYAQPDLSADAPILLLFSGVDTWKMDIHGLALQTARAQPFRVLAIDMPGTGESPAPNAYDADSYILAVLSEFRRAWPKARSIGTLGFSFAGHWAIKLALKSKVDASVSIGGMVHETFQEANVSNLRFGMQGIFGNSLRPDRPLGVDELVARMKPFSLVTQGLIQADDGRTPLLYINGNRDQHSPATDISPLRGRDNTTIQIVKNATHCATEELGTLLPAALAWLRKNLA